MKEFRTIQAYQQARLSDMFPAESMQEMAQRSGERHTLGHDFVIVEGSTTTTKSKSEYLSNPPWIIEPPARRE
jgi:hypothetical protein